MIEEQQPKKKRGRPKGSKNKVKTAKKSRKKKKKEVVVKKVGRPTKEEARAKAQQTAEEQKKQETKIKEEIRQQNTKEYPIFDSGDHVHLIEDNRVPNLCYKGIVYSHNPESQFVRVMWKDGSIQYAPAVVLRKVDKPAKKKGR